MATLRASLGRSAAGRLRQEAEATVGRSRSAIRCACWSGALELQEVSSNGVKGWKRARFLAKTGELRRSVLPQKEYRPVRPIGRAGRLPVRTLGVRQRNGIPGYRIEPACRIRSGPEVYGRAFSVLGRRDDLVWQVDCVDLARLGQAIGPPGDQFIVRVGLPPVEAGEELQNVAVAYEHGLSVIPAAVQPAATRVGPDVGAAFRAFAGSLVAAGHIDVPGAPAQRIRGLAVRLRGPQRVVVLVTVLLVGQGNNSTQLFLRSPLLQHVGVLAPVPVLELSLIHI